MLSKIILQKDLPKLVDALVTDHLVVAPTYAKNVPTFSEVQSSAEVEFSILFNEKLPMLPLKKIFLPPKQSIFKYSLTEGATESCRELAEKLVEKELLIFGASPCDITGVNILTKIFREYYTDELFSVVRDKTVIIGMNCLDHCYENCFCETMHSNDPKSGYDLMFTPISKTKLMAVPNSAKGKALLRRHPEVFQEVSSKDHEAYLKALQQKRQNFKSEFPVEGLASSIEDKFESSVWEEFTAKCLFCGSCTFVCPTCYCYSTKDNLSVDLKTGERLREWDSCYFPEFALVAGGHNFREHQSQRFRYRYLHKFVDLPRRYHLEGCVGCGRCITYCPADIDIRDVLKAIRGGTN